MEGPTQRQVVLDTKQATVPHPQALIEIALKPDAAPAGLSAQIEARQNAVIADRYQLTQRPLGVGIHVEISAEEVGELLPAVTGPGLGKLPHGVVIRVGIPKFRNGRQRLLQPGAIAALKRGTTSTFSADTSAVSRLPRSEPSGARRPHACLRDRGDWIMSAPDRACPRRRVSAGSETHAPCRSGCPRRTSALTCRRRTTIRPACDPPRMATTSSSPRAPCIAWRNELACAGGWRCSGWRRNG